MLLAFQLLISVTPSFTLRKMGPSLDGFAEFSKVKAKLRHVSLSEHIRMVRCLTVLGFCEDSGSFKFKACRVLFCQVGRNISKDAFECFCHLILVCVTHVSQTKDPCDRLTPSNFSCTSCWSWSASGLQSGSLFQGT